MIQALIGILLILAVVLLIVYGVARLIFAD